MSYQEEYKTISAEHIELVNNFIEKLFEGDVQDFWDCVSKVDQARIYGMYRVVLQYNDDLTFEQYLINDIIPGIKEVYKGALPSPGIASHLRVSETGEFLVYIVPNTEEGRLINEPTLETVFPVGMTIDADIIDNEVQHSLKVRLYHDNNYQNAAL
ncbi:hypothetical protein M3689_05665 [Alkalihalophilus marmarensis]|uniref:hypothetical protein n=1 Tax=Alkalihalophilus marmarensis TaxID=521377 RepID=UPI00203BA4D1|nr:hypothetical protein [Alkalihalophilus marmarensis]MCM3488793.1 hypothetical protein [Alkalihalophilus marmarensis]